MRQSLYITNHFPAFFAYDIYHRPSPVYPQEETRRRSAGTIRGGGGGGERGVRPLLTGGAMRRKRPSRYTSPTLSRRKAVCFISGGSSEKPHCTVVILYNSSKKKLNASSENLWFSHLEIYEYCERNRVQRFWHSYFRQNRAFQTKMSKIKFCAVLAVSCAFGLKVGKTFAHVTFTLKKLFRVTFLQFLNRFEIIIKFFALWYP